MAHYTLLNQDNIVERVFVGRDEDDLIEGVTDWEQYYAPAGYRVKRTSYNTHAGQHMAGGVAFRKNFAGVGFTYDEELDAFIPPQPFESWVLDEETCLWSAPIPMPETLGDDGKPVPYQWDEQSGSWVQV